MPGARRARRLLTLAGAALLSQATGCFTAGLWSVGLDDELVPYEVVAVERVTPEPDGGFLVHLRLENGGTRSERWPGEHRRVPDHALREACEAARWGRSDEAVQALQRAVRRGLPHRAFADRSELAPLVADPRVVALIATPVAPPELLLRDPDPEAPGPRELVHLAPPEAPEVIIARVEHVERIPPGTMTYVLLGLATPVTVALDAATLPLQMVLVAVFVDDLFDLLD